MSSSALVAGHTLTSKIKFEDVVKEVAKLVQPTWYPVILSLEVHCCEELQAQMASILQRELGGMLYAPSGESGRPQVLPSPEELRGKVLCKGPWADVGEGDEELSPEDEKYLRDAEAVAASGLKLPNFSKGLLRHRRTTGETGAGPEPSARGKAGFGSRKEKQEGTGTSQKVSQALSDVVFLGNGNRKQLAEAWKSGSAFVDSQPANQMCSFAEGLVKDYVDDGRWRSWIEYNQRNLSRLYPSGMRVDSSNYDPVPAWALGCQLVALNIQSIDTPLRYNTGLFALNGGCGYILKPPSLRSCGSSWQSQAVPSGTPAAAPPPRLGIKVVCATNVPNEGTSLNDVSDRTVDPYVSLQIIGGRQFIDSGGSPGTGGASAAGKPKEGKAKTPVVRNSVNPVFNYEAAFPVPDPEVSMLVLKLKDDSDTKIGFAVLMITELREGLRCIPLLHYKDVTPLDCSVIVEIKWLSGDARPSGVVKSSPPATVPPGSSAASPQQYTPLLADDETGRAPLDSSALPIV